MVNRPAGGARSQRWEKSDYDWYCENHIPVEQLMDRIDFGDDLIWDPCCGRGNILDVAKARGHPTVGSDVVDRYPKHKFSRGNVLLIENSPKLPGRYLSVITNPPYSYQDDIAEKIIRRIVMHHPIRKAAFLVPIAFLASNGRWQFFQREIKPSHVAILSERPSMPPGAMVDENTEFKGGMADYIWLIYEPPHRWRTETIWLKPS